MIRLHYHANEAIERPSFGFRMYTELGTLVTDTSTWLHGLDIPLVPAGDGYIDLEIDSLNLLPGRYYFSLSWTPASNPHIYDALEHAIHLDIEEAPIYGHPVAASTAVSGWSISRSAGVWRASAAARRRARPAANGEAPRLQQTPGPATGKTCASSSPG